MAPVACELGEFGSGNVCQNGTSSSQINSFNHNLRIFPNPANDQLTVASDHQKIDAISIFNITGHLIMKRQVNELFATIGTEKLKSNNVVLLKVQMGEQSFSRKIMIL